MIRKLIATALFLVAGVSHANLVTNGSFENTTQFVDNVVADYLAGGRDVTAMTLLPGTTALPGWSVINPGGYDLIWYASWAMSASNGSYFLDLTGNHRGFPYASLTQTIATTAGHIYTLEYDIGTLPMMASAVLANAGTFSEYCWSWQSPWRHCSHSFTAISSSTSISLTGAYSWNDVYLGLDNVSVVDRTPGFQNVPEPGSLALLGIALAGFGGVRCRKLT